MTKAHYPRRGATVKVDANLLGPCGFNCGFCLAYKDKKCLGCRYQAQRSEESGLVEVFCDTLVCATEKGVIKCADCEEYPCKKYDKEGGGIFSESYIAYIRNDIRSG